MIILNILLGVVASVLLLGVIGEKDGKKNISLSISFAAVVLLIIALNTVMS